MLIDPAAAPTDQRKQSIMKVAAEINVHLEYVPQRIEKSISWLAPLSCNMPSAAADIQEEIMIVLEAEEAVKMIYAFHQEQRGEMCDDDVISLSKWIESNMATLPGKNLTLVIIGLGKYFSKHKNSKRQQHRELITGKPAKGKKKAAPSGPVITREEAEEAFVDAQILTGCVIQDVASDEDFAVQLKFLTKAVREKPSKKDRLSSSFSFLDDGVTGLNVSKDGTGLIKVWKHQLMQLKNLGSEMADAIVAIYPSPQSLFKACENLTCTEAEKMIGEINVRRAAGVISTNRKIGKEHARRIFTFVTSTDPNQIVK